MPEATHGSDLRTVALACAEFAADVRLTGVPEAVFQHTADHIVDTVGVMLSALTLDTSRMIQQLVREDGGTPIAHALGMEVGVNPTQAALVNGVLAHSLDFDDTHLPSVLHPSASVVPAGLACAEAQGLDGATAITAIAVGTELTVRLGMAGFDEAQRASVYFDYGQHATSICGAIGSAVTAGLLYNLDTRQLSHAIGIAASMASGILEGNRVGGTVKRLHCGWAAHNGVAAAQLSRLGMTGPSTAIEGRFGFLRAFLKDRAHPSAVTLELGSTWEALNTVIKIYPANHFTHSIIENGLFLREAIADIDSVRHIRIGVPEAVLRTLAEPIEVKRSPKSSYEAQFSGPFALCVGLLAGDSRGIGLDAYDISRISDPRAQKIMDKIEMYADSECSEVFPYHFPAVTHVEFQSGQIVSAKSMMTLGSVDNPVSPHQLKGKFLLNAGSYATESNALALFDILSRLEEAPSVFNVMTEIHDICATRQDSLNER